MIKKSIKFILGMCILFAYYALSYLIVKLSKIHIPPAILGLALFALSLQYGIVKEDWIKTTVDFMLKNMAILFVPFIVGLMVYKDLLLQNYLAIILVVIFSTTITIVLTGIFVEIGIKYLRLLRMKKRND